jgi:hypothetical protein
VDSTRLPASPGSRVFPYLVLILLVLLIPRNERRMQDYELTPLLQGANTFISSSSKVPGSPTIRSGLPHSWFPEFLIKFP